MLRMLLTFLYLRRLRIRAPELFDGELATACVLACIREDAAL